MLDPHEELLTAEEAAVRLGVTRSYLYRLIKRGFLAEAVGIRGGREVKLVPASALARLHAHEGLLVRDVAPQPQPDAVQSPVTDPSLTARPAPCDPTDRSMTAGGQQAVVGDRSATGHWPVSDPQATLLAELREELRNLRDQLANERAARERLETRLHQPASPSDELVTAISRANEVTALVKASDLKQQRILESLLRHQQWGRAKRIAYAVYLGLTAAIGITAAILIYHFATRLNSLIPY